MPDSSGNAFSGSGEHVSSGPGNAPSAPKGEHVSSGPGNAPSAPKRTHKSSGPGNALSGGPKSISRPDMGKYDDPLLQFNFSLQITGDKGVHALFTECTGLQAKRKPHSYKEGGVNDYSHKLPGRVEYSDVTLKVGITANDFLWHWYWDGIDRAQAIYKDVTISLFYLDGSKLCDWSLKDAYPIEWRGPDLKTNSSNVAFEAVVFAHHGLTMEKRQKIK